MNRSSILRAKRWRDLRRRRPQVIAVAITIFLGVFLFIASYNSYLGLSKSYDKTYQSLHFADIWITGDDLSALEKALAEMPEVKRIDHRVRGQVPIKIAGRQLTIDLLSTPNSPDDANQLLLSQGSLPHSQSLAAEQHGASHFKLEPGESVQLYSNGQWRSYDLSGTLISSEYLWLAKNRSDTLTNPDDFAVFFAAPSFFAENQIPVTTELLLSLHDDSEITLEKIKNKAWQFGASDVYDASQQASNSTLRSDVQGFAALAFLFPLLFLSVAGLSASVLLGRMIALQRSEIGMLIANGFRSRSIFLHFTGHGLVISLLGGIPGIALGIYAGNWITDAYAQFLHIPIVSHSTPISTTLAGIFFVLATGCIAGGIPAWKASRLAPATAMSPVAPKGGGGNLLSSLLPRFFRTPGTLMVLRNLSRNRKRSLSTILGTAMAAVLILTSLAMQDSIADSIGKQFEEIDTRDLTLQLDRPVSESTLTKLLQDPQIGRAEQFSSEGIVVLGHEKSMAFRLDVFEPATTLHGFSGAPFGKGLLLHAEKIAALNLHVGDTVQVRTTDGRRYSLPLAGAHHESFTSAAYVDSIRWQALTKVKATAVILGLSAGATPTALREKLSALPQVVASIDHSALRSQVEEMMGMATLFISIMVLFGVIMAVALIFNAMSVAIAERSSEVATMAANGISQRWIGWTIATENMLVVTVGVGLGIFLGKIISRQFLSQMANEGMSFSMVLNNQSYWLTISILLCSALLAQLPGLRRLSKLDLPVAMRERSA